MTIVDQEDVERRLGRDLYSGEICNSHMTIVDQEDVERRLDRDLHSGEICNSHMTIVDLKEAGEIYNSHMTIVDQEDLERRLGRDLHSGEICCWFISWGHSSDLYLPLRGKSPHPYIARWIWLNIMTKQHI